MFKIRRPLFIMNAKLLCIVFVCVVVSVAKAQEEPCREVGGYKAHGEWFMDTNCNKCYCNNGVATCPAPGGCSKPRQVVFKDSSTARDCDWIGGWKDHGAWFLDEQTGQRCYCNDSLGHCFEDDVGCGLPLSLRQ
ncbi:uncharacterized protein LOC127867356 isoform X2 [Dreissena polymorpha]|uniref:Uncharacterized protein n=1 Tax=Dreissena polymorpha TaxID=45954 RepID=A0A9D4S584_DREPO|nr:uncharacterized protein LOC127867356 isoform X2 [Dreissena polymorpha]KAH3891060.1 hypothetical protein DPMN_015151 [Dreissena polymorpha]